MAKTIKKKPEPKKNLKSKFKFDEVTVDLTDRQKLFCMEYVRCSFNGYQAAMNAGYSKTSARAQASYLLTNPNILKLVTELKKDIALQVGISAYQIAQEYARIGFSDIRKIFDENDNLITITNIPEDAARNISSIEIFEEFEGKGDARVSIGLTKKIKLFDKVRALDSLSKMLGYDGVTKVANTDTQGNEVVYLPKKELHK